MAVKPHFKILMTFPCYRMNLVAVMIIGFFASQAEGKIPGGSKLRHEASCFMRQHDTGVVLGKVTFAVWDDPGDKQVLRYSAFLKSTTIKAGNHGFHIHQNAITGYDCKTAGGHYNPNGKSHGSLYGTGDDRNARHVGDLGNVEAGDGEIWMRMQLFLKAFSLEGEQSIVGRSVVLHAGEDDLGLGGQTDSKTTGHAGGRLACCILGDTAKN